MRRSKLKKIASDLWDLEQKCQNDENVSENMKKMTEISQELSFNDLLQLIEYMDRVYGSSIL